MTVQFCLSSFPLEEGSIAMKNVPLRLSQIHMEWSDIKALHFTRKKDETEALIHFTLLSHTLSVKQ